jgi:hypothetical protein
MLLTTAMMAKNQHWTPGTNLLFVKSEIVKPKSWKINSFESWQNICSHILDVGVFLCRQASKLLPGDESSSFTDETCSCNELLQKTSCSIASLCSKKQIRV